MLRKFKFRRSYYNKKRVQPYQDFFLKALIFIVQLGAKIFQSVSVRRKKKICRLVFRTKKASMIELFVKTVYSFSYIFKGAPSWMSEWVQSTAL